jgi:hypothetical protein
VKTVTHGNKGKCHQIYCKQTGGVHYDKKRAPFGSTGV